ncbi:MAG: CPBP family intramembrane glutamic endopeptidase [Ramlibacter sp.]
MRFQLNQRQAVLVAIFPVVALALLNHFYTAWLFTINANLFWVADGVHFVLVPLLVWCLVLRPAGIGAAQCGLSWSAGARGGGMEVGTTVFLAVALVAWTWPVGRVLGLVFWEQCCTFQYQQAIARTPAAAWLTCVYFAATAALGEELIYRALPWLYAQAVVPERWRRAVYVLATSTVFALAYSEQGIGGILATFWFGVVTARMYSRYRSLWPLVLGHFLYDLVVYAPWSR